jgi:mono/diheme cytochrome c family protein
MMKRAIAATILIFAAGTATAQPDGLRSRWGMMGPGIMANLARHHQAMMYGIPAPYRAARDPLPNTPVKLRHGAAVFQQNCAACHGPGGSGNGPASRDLVPPPANLAWLVHTPISRSDPYMLWTISEGGQSFGSDMPSFKRTLSRNDIWSVISYIRAGLPFQ